MTLSITFSKSPKAKSDTAVVGIYKDNKLSAPAGAFDKQGGGFIARYLKDHPDFKGKYGQTLVLPAPDKSGFGRLILVGFGDVKDWNAHEVESIGGKLMATLSATGSVSATLILDEKDANKALKTAQVAAHLAMGLSLRSYKFEKYKSKAEGEKHAKGAKKIEIVTADAAAATKAFAPMKAVSDSVFFARDLVNEPPNVLYPESYAALIKKELTPLGVEVEILDEKRMAKLGFGAHLAVGQGSERQPRVVIMRWNGGKPASKSAGKGAAKGKNADAPIAFVGKGVTFDTGGISIKPAAGMDEMKMDMGGSAAVVGTLRALAARKSTANVIGIVALAENMPSHNAFRPGDIVTSLSGKTIEILNTDAEGRLVLCDALTYVQDTYKPRMIIDLATLTGAIMVALGYEYTGAFVNDDTLWGQIEEAGKETGEKYWRMPLDESYRREMDSPVADLRNLGNLGRFGGACSAAGFLERFVKDGTPWAHLDIAGTAWIKADRATVPKFATGVGVRTLDRLVANNYE